MTFVWRYRLVDWVGLATNWSGLFSGFLELYGIFRNYRIFRDLGGFLEVLVNIFKVFFCLFVTKSLNLEP